MQGNVVFYVKLSMLLVVLTAAIGFHYSVRGLQREPVETTWHVLSSNPDRGRVLLRQHGCGACHIVPGVSQARGKVGPKLDRLRHSIYVAGVIPHTPQNLVSWIQDPKEIDPRTAMPDLGVNGQDARDMAAYLYSID